MNKDMTSKLSVSWDLYQNSICNGFSSLQQLGEFVDMTLAADGHFVKVHQTLIALSSPYLRALIKTVPSQHPVIFLDNVCQNTLCYLLEYIYTGEVAVPRDKLHLFIRAAKALCLTGIENIIAKYKQFQDLQDTNNEVTVDQIDGNETNTVRMEPLPNTHMSDINTEETFANDDHFQPNADTIEIDVDTHLNIPCTTDNKDEFNTSTDDFEKTLRQIPTPLLTPSGNNLSALVNLKSPIPHLNVSPNDFNCDSNTSFHMEQFFKGLNSSNQENSQNIHNSISVFTERPSEVLEFTVPSIHQKSMPLIDGVTPEEISMQEEKNIVTTPGKGCKGIKQLIPENSNVYQEQSLNPKGMKKIRNSEDDSITWFSPLLDFIDNEDVNGDLEEQDAMPIEIDNGEANFEGLISMPLMDVPLENSFTDSTENHVSFVQKASEIEISNTGEVFLRPHNPVKISSLRNHRHKRKSSALNLNEIDSENNYKADQNSIHQKSDEPGIEIHLPETEENMDFANSSEIPVSAIETGIHQKQPLELTSASKIPKIHPAPNVKIKVAGNSSKDLANLSDIIKRVNKRQKSKLVHRIQIVKKPEDLKENGQSENEINNEAVSSIGIRQIKITNPLNSEQVKLTKHKKRIKRITIRKPQALDSKSSKTNENPTKPLGISFKLPERKQSDIVLETKSNEEVKNIEGPLDENALAVQSILEEPTIQITHQSEDKSVPSVKLDITGTADPNHNMIQYSISGRGSLQIIVNRYIYYSHYRSFGTRRRWRCVNYRRGKCLAYIDTDDNCIVGRINPHNHAFHDQQILQRVKNHEVFSAIPDAKKAFRSRLLQPAEKIKEPSEFDE